MQKITTYNEDIAKLLKFYLQFNNPFLKFKLPLKRIQAKSFYNKYKKQIDLACTIFSKYKLDIKNYIVFFVNILEKQEKDIQSDFITNSTFEKYIDWLKLIEKQNKIYSYFLKSAKNIAEKSIELGYYSTKDFIRYLISKKKISEYFTSGKISIYYFAAIPNFKKIIPKLDLFSRNDLQRLYDRFEMYNSEITTVFLKKTNQKVNPIKYTDELIFKIKNSK